MIGVWSRGIGKLSFKMFFKRYCLQAYYLSVSSDIKTPQRKQKYQLCVVYIASSYLGMSSGGNHILLLLGSIRLI